MWKLMVAHWECDIISHHTLPWTNTELSVPLIYGGYNLGDKFLETESLMFSLYVGNKKKWEVFFFFKILMQKKHMKRVKKYSMMSKIFLLLRWGILFSVTCMKRAVRVLIIRESFSVQSFLHRQEDFLNRDALSRFHCKLNSWLGDGSQCYHSCCRIIIYQRASNKM